MASPASGMADDPHLRILAPLGSEQLHSEFKLGQAGQHPSHDWRAYKSIYKLSAPPGSLGLICSSQIEYSPVRVF